MCSHLDGLVGLDGLHVPAVVHHVLEPTLEAGGEAAGVEGHEALAKVLLARVGGVRQRLPGVQPGAIAGAREDSWE